jgi:hypothetical protein
MSQTTIDDIKNKLSIIMKNFNKNHKNIIEIIQIYE